ncbi:MAG: fibronectin type III domain-containing protein [Nitrospira sp.]|nr:fibronectin type III domain-containing protein [Nitrospira sp.]
MTLMRHFLPTHITQTARSHRTPTSTPRFWQMLGITAFLCLSLAPEGLAQTTVSPTSLTYNAVQNGTNPANQTISVSRTRTSTVTLTTSDNATWLTVLNAPTSMTTKATLTVGVNTSGLKMAGTYNATITIKVGTWYTKTVPVTLYLSPSLTSTTPPPSTTSSATLTWNAVTSTPVSGYKVWFGTISNQLQSINVGAVTSYTVNSLTVGRMYYFAVSAYNSAGESPLSTQASKTIQ